MTARPIDFIERMLELHADEPPYRWAQPGPLPEPAGAPVPAAASTVVLVSLAGVRRTSQDPYDLKGDTSIRLVPIDSTRADLAVDHFGFRIARVADDIEPVAPFVALTALAASGTIAGVAPTAVCLMGATYSQRRVVTELAPVVTEAVRDLVAASGSGVPLALIVPACPLDHQTAAFLAGAIEAAGIRTLVLSGARDITEHVGAPRTVYLHAPLGWLLGMPGDRAGQRARLAAALEIGAALPGTGETHDLPQAYPTGATGTPAPFAHPDLEDWTSREFAEGYDTGATR